MKSLLTIGLVIALTSCMTHRSAALPQSHFERNIATGLEKLPMIWDSNASVESCIKCDKLKVGSRERKECLADYLETFISKINLLYSYGEPQRARDLWKSELDANLAGFRRDKKDYKTYPNMADLFDANYSLLLYEIALRWTHVIGLANYQHQQHASETNEYNADLDRRNSEIGSSLQGLQQLQNQRRLDNLEKQQNYDNWYRQTGGSGIRPPNTY